MCGQWTAANSICAYMYFKAVDRYAAGQAGVHRYLRTSKAETELEPASYRYCVLHAGKASLLLVEQTSG